MVFVRNTDMNRSYHLTVRNLESGWRWNINFPQALCAPAVAFSFGGGGARERAGMLFSAKMRPSHCFALAAVQMPRMLVLSLFFPCSLRHVTVLGKPISDEETVWQGQKNASGL